MMIKIVKAPLQVFFNANAIVSVALILNTRKNQKPFILNFGNFFVTDIDTNEQKISVTVKAQDYIGVRKNDYLNLGIGDKQTPMSALQNRKRNKLICYQS
ncbi:hypothetical protein [Treponema phagedenis]|uniref:hypothetical protein n=1 Tax=Treponema phagedenis TaxID=162 RepID=UPI0015A298B6|nr:hypothetical protein [Treponema phagedenis]NVP24940.1 hypothetical protein [Treponema phagedenis]QLC59350.1 hypothetical protein HW453_11490 [Treponema phagedenis]